MKQALVTGATGFLGNNLVRELNKKGVKVVIFRRPTSSLAKLKGADFHEYMGDLLSKRDWQKAMEGCDTLFHLAGVGSFTRKGRAERWRVNVTAVETMLAALKESPPKRLVHVSSAAAVGISLSPEVILDERSPFNANGFHYFKTKRMGESLILSAAKEGLDAVVVNPGTVLGLDGAREIQREFFRKAALGKMFFYPPGGTCFTFLEDLMEGILAATEKGGKGERYILGGHNLLFRDYLRNIAEKAGVRPPRYPFPKSLLPFAAGLADLFFGKLGWEAGQVAGLYGFYSSKKAEEKLGYRITPMEKILESLLPLPANQGTFSDGTFSD